MNPAKDVEKTKLEARKILKRVRNRHSRNPKTLTPARMEEILDSIKAERNARWEEKLAVRT